MGAVSIAFVTEALGTKNLVADAVRAYTGRTHYDAIARDTVATILNDLCSVGARPAALTAYWGAGDGAWFPDAERARDLTQGWAAACEECRVSWGGGETQVLPSLIEAGKVVLGGSAIGIITPVRKHAPRRAPGSRRPNPDRARFGHSRQRAQPRAQDRGRSPARLPNAHQRRPHLRRGPARPHTAVRAAGRRTCKSRGYRCTTRPTSPATAGAKSCAPARDLTLCPAASSRRFRPCSPSCSSTPSSPPKKRTAPSTWAPASRCTCRPRPSPAALAVGKQSGFDLLHAGEVQAGPQRVVIEPLGITFEGDSLQVRR